MGRGLNKKARLLAFYLPQYHPIKENNEWWGKGFTEWTNVTKATPLFNNHSQPKFPTELGYYDLRLPEVREEQAELAKSYGVESFCYWHYWFGNGKTILERPFKEVLASKKPDFPFCLAWANESWKGVWHGMSKNKMLVEQQDLGKEDYEKHFYSVLEAFQDDRYSKVDDKPIFIVYRPHNIKDPKIFADLWNELAVKNGLKGIYLIGVAENWDPIQNNFNAVVANAPRINKESRNRLRNLKIKLFGKKTPTIHSYKKYRDFMIGRHLGPNEFPIVLPNWDNTPRADLRGLVLEGSTPELFKEWLKHEVKRVEGKREEERIIFVKSWNEWAEGNFVEPDVEFGRAYLDSIKDAVLV